MIKDNKDGTFSIVRPKVWDDEPVAFVTGVRQFDPVMADTVLKVGTPLYTHPAELTDEEISDVINNEFGHKFNGYEICFLYAFARAILRKASE